MTLSELTLREVAPWLGSGGALTFLGFVYRWMKARKRLRLTLDVDDFRVDFQITRSPPP